MQHDIHRWVGMLWIGFLVLWTAGALVQKRTLRKEPISSRLLQLCLCGVAYMLLASPQLNFGLLAAPFVPGNIFFSLSGLSLTILGFAFAIWARVFLGGNWSSGVTIKADHELVRNGPYALVRHPIYSAGNCHCFPCHERVAGFRRGVSGPTDQITARRGIYDARVWS